MEQDNKLTGILLVDKPVGMTSHDVVNILRRITGIRKIGHAGTLDPFATGLLICLIGRPATKKSDEFMGFSKMYETTVVLGKETDSYDIDGKVVADNGPVEIEDLQERVLEVLKNYEGETLQVPPMFSAKKVKGKKLYELAREGKEIERKPVKINVHTLELLSVVEGEYPELKLLIGCSKGTYIRSIGHDIGKDLGVGAFLSDLRRTEIGDYSVKKAVQLDGLTLFDIEDAILPV